jgi:hypothetical protein
MYISINFQLASETLVNLSILNCINIQNISNLKWISDLNIELS